MMEKWGRKFTDNLRPGEAGQGRGKESDDQEVGASRQETEEGGEPRREREQGVGHESGEHDRPQTLGRRHGRERSC